MTWVFTIRFLQIRHRYLWVNTLCNLWMPLLVCFGSVSPGLYYPKKFPGGRNIADYILCIWRLLRLFTHKHLCLLYSLVPSPASDNSCGGGLGTRLPIILIQHLAVVDYHSANTDIILALSGRRVRVYTVATERRNLTQTKRASNISTHLTACS